MSMGVTDVIGSTPVTSTSPSCSTKARIALSSPCKCSISSSLTAMRARCAMSRTVLASTDMLAPLRHRDRFALVGNDHLGGMALHLGDERVGARGDDRDRAVVARDRGVEFEEALDREGGRPRTHGEAVADR